MHEDVQRAWMSVVETQDPDAWLEYLDRREISDHFAFLRQQNALTILGKTCDVHEWINYISALTRSEYHSLVDDKRLPIAQRLAVATFIRWRDRLERLLKPQGEDALPGENDRLPRDGVVQYFPDALVACILVRYRRIGSMAEIGECLAFPEPKAFFDPRLALRYARSDQKLELLREALFNRYKIVIHRNVLTYIDREAESAVFGPSIDTLIINEWLFTSRYIAERTVENSRYFERVLTRELAEEGRLKGTRFLEIGAGNGLLTATFARNEAKIRRICAIDVSIEAIAATYRNSASQRRLPRLGRIGDRGIYIVGAYHRDYAPAENDLVVCNPPYIPASPIMGASRNLHPLANATIGTQLIESVVSDSPRLLAPAGKLVMIISDMAHPELQRALPDGFTVAKVLSKEVPFDVGSIRRENAHLDWLKNERGLKHTGGRYLHSVSVFEISRT